MLVARLAASILTLALVGLLFSGCTRQVEQPKSETQVKVQPVASATASPLSLATASPVASPTAKEPPPPPRPDEVKLAVARVFAQVATPEIAGSSFVVGDFNGDGSEDLAVIVKPNESGLADVNSEFANWTLEDPRRVIVRTADRTSPPPAKPVQAEKGELLLAVIHGVGPAGWHNPEAKQTFLLRNGVGSGMVKQPAQAVRASKASKAIKGSQKLPPIRGDAIRVTIDGQRGMLFWTGAKYGWISAGVE